MGKKQKQTELKAPARKPYRVAWSMTSRSYVAYRAGGDEYSSKPFKSAKEAAEYAEQQNEAFATKSNVKRRG